MTMKGNRKTPVLSFKRLAAGKYQANENPDIFVTRIDGVWLTSLRSKTKSFDTKQKAQDYAILIQGLQ